MSILRNLFINRYRQKKAEPERVDWERIDQVYESIMEQGQKADKNNPESLFFSRLTSDKINEAIKGLPEEFRTAIVLVDIQELTYEETAKIMECPIGTVRSRLSRGRRILQVALRDYAIQSGLLMGTCCIR